MDEQLHVFQTSVLNGSSQLHAPGALPPGKEPLPHPLDRRLAGPQRRSGRGGEENKISAPAAGKRITDVQPIA